MKTPVACEFCAGAGGMSYGLGQAGFEIRFANEINEQAAATYMYNHPSTTMIVRDMKDLAPREVTEITGDKISLIAAGLPCQGFSTAGKRNVNDPRNKLFRSFLNFVNKLEPKSFLIENVVGILSTNGGKVVSDIEKSFGEIGYNVSKTVLNASDFGVPQNRRRVFIFGIRKGKQDINSIKPTGAPKVTVSDAIGDLSFLKSGQSAQKYLTSPMTKYQLSMRNDCEVLNNHEASRHGEKTLRRFSMIREGQSVGDLPPSLRIRKMVMYRLKSSEPARTLTTLPDDYIHYSQDRVLTVREMARLQSFPDSYLFLGNRSTGGLNRRKDCPQSSQTANAVPPLLAKAVGEWILSKI